MYALCIVGFDLNWRIVIYSILFCCCLFVTVRMDLLDLMFVVGCLFVMRFAVCFGFGLLLLIDLFCMLLHVILAVS